jgi:large subunit ribosomal protein L21
MYAVFEDGSRQYRVSEGELVRLDFREVELGSQLQFDKVLLVSAGEGLQIGRPYVGGARILAEVVDHPSTKLYIQHFRRRKNYRRRVGHNQPFTTVKISHILLPGQDLPPQSAAAKEPATQSAS